MSLFPIGRADDGGEADDHVSSLPGGDEASDVQASGELLSDEEHSIRPAMGISPSLRRWMDVVSKQPLTEASRLPTYVSTNVRPAIEVDIAQVVASF